MMNPFIESFLQTVQPLRKQIVHHDIFQQLDSLEHLQLFMESHAFVVWEDLSIVRAFQKSKNKDFVPWALRENAAQMRSLYATLLLAEADLDMEGKPQNHLDLYIQAMEEVGANTSKIGLLMRYLEQGVPWVDAVSSLRINPRYKEGIIHLLRHLELAEAHHLYALFGFARLHQIPPLLEATALDLAEQHPEHVATFVYYLEQARQYMCLQEDVLMAQMLTEQCGQDKEKWDSCTRLVAEVLQWRIKVLDSISRLIPQEEVS